MAEELKYKCKWCPQRFATESDRVSHHMTMQHWLADSDENEILDTIDLDFTESFEQEL